MGLAALAADPTTFYRLLDQAADKPRRHATAAPLPLEQHLLPNLQVVDADGVEVIVPPLHHRVVTARVVVAERGAALADARTTFEAALAALEADFIKSSAGLGITVAWGLPYFRRFVPGQTRKMIPLDRRATATRRRTTSILEHAERFPSDPAHTRLELNDLAVLLRSDDLDALDEAQGRLFDDLPGLFELTSIRNGFIGGGFGGAVSLPKQFAMQARIPGAEHMPETAELFLGFTSTTRHALGPSKIANIETLGYAQLRNDYFVGGTHMHLSHLHENLDAWYLNFDHTEQLAAMFRPGLHAKRNTRTIDQPPSAIETAEQTRAAYAHSRRIGHAGAIQSASRLPRTVVGPDGTAYPRGTAVPQRADFNTLDNPFTWSAESGTPSGPAAGTHFVVFNPTSDDFRRVRLAMDGVLPDGVRLDLPPRSVGQGINSVFHATHRQNFLVPPRPHRSFPLTEIRG